VTAHAWTNATLATMVGEEYGLLERGAVLVEDGKIAWVGATDDLPKQVHCTECRGALITPGLVDCHTHLVYGGDRANEFEMRLKGATYEDIARAGGGIISTVKATRAASEAELLAQSEGRLQAMMREGVTTIEIKTGYGLALEHERKCLRVARELAQRHRVDVQTTFLGAHAVPPEYAGRADHYIDEVVRMLGELHREGLVDAVDAFCERIAFSPEQTRKVFDAARSLGLPVKLHAEQLSDSGGAQLAAGFEALSCDHLEWLGEEGAAAMKSAGSVAVLLPGAFYFLRETRVPPVDLLRRHGVPMAVSTDCNPGSSPCTSLLLMLNMACTLFRLTPAEALAGVTRNAARALGLRDRGTLEAGMRADFVLWDVARPAQLAYAFGANPCREVVFEGRTQ
jgi:imidazolonepropionase